MNELLNLKRAGIYSNDDFICVQTNSGYRLSVIDLDGETIFLSCQVTPKELGRAVKAALAVSRVIPLDEIVAYHDLNRVKEVSEEWKRQIVERFKYKNESRIFKNMKYCILQSMDGIIKFSPTVHKGKDSWIGAGMEEEDYVFIEECESSEKVGKAAALALSRCIG